MPVMERLYLVGQTYDVAVSNGRFVWDFQGIFDSEEKAIAACRNEWYWIAPVELNVEQPDETVPFAGAYYPWFDYDGWSWDSAPRLRRPTESQRLALISRS